MSDRRPPQKRHHDRVALNPRQLQRILDGRDHAIAGTIDALTRRVEALEQRHADRLASLQRQLANDGSLSYNADPFPIGLAASVNDPMPSPTGQPAAYAAWRARNPLYIHPAKVTWWTRLRSLFSRA